MPRLPRFLPEIACGAVLCWWMAAKLTLFDALEYTSDLFSSTQMSQSVFRGRPLLWENGFGDHKTLHNYYLDPLLFPFTRLFGPPGLFLATTLAWAAAAFAICFLARTGSAWKRPILWGAVACLLMGPAGFWFIDDPIYGWHTEYLYLPLALVYAILLARRKRGAWFVALAIVLVREDGAIVAWSIHAVSVWLQKDSVRSRLIRICGLTALWLGVFAAGLALQIALRPNGGNVRFLSALEHVHIVFADPILRAALVHSTLTAAMLISCGLLFVAAVSWRAAAAAFAAMLPLLPTLLIASAAFSDELGVRDYGFSWGPRIVMLWAVLAGAVLLSLALDQRSATRPMQTVLVLSTVLISIVGQAQVLRHRRAYDSWQRATAFLPDRKHLFIGSMLKPDEDQFLRCLGRELPRWTPVSAGGSLFARFSRQDIVWPDRLATAWAQPQVVACDIEQRLPYDYGCVALARRKAAAGFGDLRVGGISVSFDEALRQPVARCASRP